MANNVINGTDFCLFLGTGTTKSCIALAQDCKISTSMSTRKIASKDSGKWEESAVGRMSWSCDSSNLFTQDVLNPATGYTFDTLMDIYISRIPVTVTFAITTTSGMGFPQTIGTGKTLIGTAIITKLDLSAKDNDNTTFSISLEGTGALVHA